MNHYKTLRLLKKEGYSAQEVEQLVPFEKDVYIALITQEYQKQNQENQK